MVLDRPCKLKDLAMKSSYYRLLNTFCIFTNSHWIFCQCDQSQGCQSKPVNGMLADKSYCYICHVGVIYVEERIKNLRKIADVYNNFLNIKDIFSYVLTSIQLAINFGCIILKQVTKQDLEIAIGVILKIILTNAIILFVGTTNKYNQITY